MPQCLVAIVAVSVAVVADMCFLIFNIIIIIFRF